MPPGAVKVDRTTRWGNPFTVADCGSVAVAVAQHRRWMQGEVIAPDGQAPPSVSELTPHLPAATWLVGAR